MQINDFIAEACRIQAADTPADRQNFAAMLAAATTMTPAAIIGDVVQLGTMLDNTITGLRRMPATFQSGRKATDGAEVPRRLSALLEYVASLKICDEQEALEIYWAFEEIHPLRDGNGRIGMVLYNALLNRLSDPAIPGDKPGW